MPFIEHHTKDSPELDEFISEVESTFDILDPSTFWRCRGAFELFGRSAALAAIGNIQIRKMLDDPTESSGQWGVGKLILTQKLSYSLSLSWSNRGGRESPFEPLSTHGGHALVLSLSKCPIEARFYRVSVTDFEIFEPDKILTFSHAKTLEPGGVLEIDGGQWIVDLAEKPGMCILNLVTAPLYPHIWSFDRCLLKSYGISASDIQMSQIKVIMQIFRELQFSNGIDLVNEFVGHPVHDVRWEAMKTLAALDQEMAVKSLSLAKEDPHPHIRAAAVKAIRSLTDGSQGYRGKLLWHTPSRLVRIRALGLRSTLR
ncbi:MAG: HEAT repeat domain-containing protein [Steroidobacteraceae bacterium]